MTGSEAPGPVPGDARRRRTIALRYAAGAGLAVAAVYISIAGLDWDGLAHALRTARLGWIGGAIASVLVTLALVTLRWGVLVGPGDGRPRWRVLWDAVVVGQAVNILAPLRFGEGARLVMTSHGLGLPPAAVGVAIVLERLLDVGAFAAASATLMMAGSLPGTVAAAAPGAVMLALVTMGGLLLSTRLLPGVSTWLQRRLPEDSRLGRWLEAQSTAVRHGWRTLTVRHRVVPMLVLTAMVLMSSALTNLLVMRAFALPVPAIAALVLLVVLQVGTAVVSVPGNIGVFHYLTVVTLAQWQVSGPLALAAAIVLHVVSLGPKILLAAIALAVTPATTAPDR